MAEIEIINPTTFKTLLGDYSTIISRDGHADADIIIGGSDLNRFIPNINVGKWSDEAWLNINLGFMNSVAGSGFLSDGKIQVIDGNAAFRTYNLNNHALEIEVLFASRPPFNYFDMDLAYSDNLLFFRQEELSDDDVKGVIDSWDISEGPAPTIHEAKRLCRPENVLGSYAVYIGKRNNRYKTGKIAHLYAWEMIDNNGNRQKAEIYIDTVAKKLRVVLDGQWLDQAAYPVRVMGIQGKNGTTMGLTTAGASNNNYGAVDRAVFIELGDPGENGTLNHMGSWFYRANNTSREFRICSAYDDSGTVTLIRTGVNQSDANCNYVNWEFTDTTHTDSLSNGTTYWGVLTNEYANNYFTYDSDGYTTYRDNTYSWDSPPSTFDKDATLSGYRISVWMDYTAESGATHSLKGSAGGVAGADGSAVAKKVMSGDVSGLGGADALLLANRLMLGSAAGISGADGSLKRDLWLKGPAEGISGVAGILNRIRGVKGTADGLSGAVAVLNKFSGLNGSASGISSVDGSMIAIRSLLGDAEGISSAVASLTISGQINLVGSVAIISGADAVLISDRALVGDVDGISDATGALTVSAISEVLLKGTSDAVSAVSGLLNAVRQMSGGISGLSGANGILVADRLLIGGVDGISALTGALTVTGVSEVLLKGSIDAVSSVSGNAALIRTLKGVIQSQAGADANLQLLIKMTGSIDAAASLLASLTVTGIGMGVIVDPTIESLSVVRSFETQSIVRSFESLTESRIIESK